MSSINFFGPTHKKFEKETKRREKKLKTTAPQEMYEFPPSYNADEHPGIKITAGPHTTAKGYRKKHHRKSKKHHKKSKKHNKKHNKKTNRRQ
jgi:hypothetical protein